MGQIVFVGVVAAATGDVIQGQKASNINSITEIKTPRKSILEIYHNKDKRKALEKFQLEYAKEVAPKQWGHMNEAQRDRLFLKESKKFILDNPKISMQLAIAKFEVFVRVMGQFGVLIILLSIIGILVTLKNPAVSTVSLWVGSYIGPFFLIISYYERYRAPIEPLLTLFAVFAINWLYCKFHAQICS